MISAWSSLVKTFVIVAESIRNAITLKIFIRLKTFSVQTNNSEQFAKPKVSFENSDESKITRREDFCNLTVE